MLHSNSDTALHDTFRFGTRSCPLCRLRNDLPFSEREQTFEHLIMLGMLMSVASSSHTIASLHLPLLAAINLILTIVTFLVLIVVYHNYGKGLLDQCKLLKYKCLRHKPSLVHISILWPFEFHTQLDFSAVIKWCSFHQSCKYGISLSFPVKFISIERLWTGLIFAWAWG